MFDPELFAISRRVNKAIEETHKRSMALPKKPIVKKTKPVEIPTPPRRVKNNTFLDLAQKSVTDHWDTLSELSKATITKEESN